MATARYVAGLRARLWPFPPEALRLELGRSLEFLLGVEMLRTEIEPSWDEIARLAVIAAIRTALHDFLQREIAHDIRLATGADRETMRELRAPAWTPAAHPGVPTAGGNRSHGQGLPA
jgi:hypothetical protein